MIVGVCKKMKTEKEKKELLKKDIKELKEKLLELAVKKITDKEIGTGKEGDLKQKHRDKLKNATNLLKQKVNIYELIEKANEINNKKEGILDRDFIVECINAQIGFHKNNKNQEAINSLFHIKGLIEDKEKYAKLWEKKYKAEEKK